MTPEMKEAINELLSRTKITYKDLTALTGISRPTLLKIVGNESVWEAKKTTFMRVVKRIQLCSNHGTLPVHNPPRELPAVRLKKINVAIATALSIEKARLAKQAEAHKPKADA